MIYVSAGHNSKSKNIKPDPGAINKDGIKEGDLTIEFRNLVAIELTKLGVKFITDSDEENLSMYLKRIQTGRGSVVIEYHFDAAGNENATGTTVVVGSDADRLDQAFAKDLAVITANFLGIRNRGVINERATHRGRLGLMRESGIVALVELGFLTNPADLRAYHLGKESLAEAHAHLILKYENFIS